MNFSGIGDLAQNLMLRRQGAGLKAQMTKLTEELTTGKSQDTSARVRGDFGPLASIERHIGQLSAFQRVRDDLNTQMVFIQSSLGVIQNSMDGYGASLLASATLEQPDQLAADTASARSKLEQVVASLNTQQGGRNLFSGIATDQTPLTTVDTMMSELQVTITGSVSSADLISRVDSWFFDTGGGFETSIYGGGDDLSGDIRISEERRIEQPITAKDDGFRNLLRGLAVATLVSEGTAPVVPEDVSTLIEYAGQSIITGHNAITSYQAKIGEIEATLERENTSARAEQTLMSAAKAKLVSVDPYEAAAELEAVQFQMETLYVLTARMSQLRLTDFLR